MLGKISSERVRAAAKRYLSKKQYVLGVLKPEAASAPAAPATPATDAAKPAG